MKNVEALKKLYIKLGGNAEDVANVTTIADAIDKLTEVAQGGGSGGEPFIVTLTFTGDTTATGDKTAAEIKEAVEDGKQIVICADYGETTVYLNTIVYEANQYGFINLQAIAITTYNLLEVNYEPVTESDTSWAIDLKAFNAGLLQVDVTIDTVGADRTETLQYVFTGIENAFSEGKDVYIFYFDEMEAERWYAPVSRIGYVPNPDVPAQRLYFVEIANGYRWETDSSTGYPSRTVTG